MTMRILVLSDIHANLTALLAVLKEAGPVDGVWCLGDLVGYGPDPNECIDLIHSLPNHVCVLGNHDAAALGQIDLDSFNLDARRSIRWLRDNLAPESVKFLEGLPERAIVDDVTLVHGSPRNPVWEYILDTYSAIENLEYFDTRLCFVGHTHIPIAYKYSEETDKFTWHNPSPNERLDIQSRAIFNPGSVGQPRDHDPKASYAIYYPETRLWEIRRTQYDVSSVQERIRAAGLPTRHALRIAEGW